MLELYLLRHAKAMRDRGEVADRHRPLSPQGHRQVAAMAGPLQRLGALEGEIHVSTATRTRQTLLGLDKQLSAVSPAQKAQYQEALYTFDDKTLRQWLTRHAAAGGPLLLIGHNPALQTLARWLCPQAPEALPTGGLLHLSLPDTLGKHQAELVTQLMPTEASHALFTHQAPQAPKLKKASLDARILGLLSHQHRLIRALEPGVIAGVDPEFLHQYRVNLRRSRAIGESILATTQMPGLKKALKRLKKRAQATSDLRDLDVFLDSLAQAAPPLSPPIRSALADWLTARAREEHAGLCRQLVQPAYRRDLQQWQDFLDSKPFRKALRRLTPDEVETVLAKRIARHDNALALLSLGAADDEALHALRKSVKRIRYLAELDPRRHKRFLSGLKQRQTLLGDFQDLCTRQAWIRTFAEAGTDAPRADSSQAERDAWLKALEKQKAALRREIMTLAPLAKGGPAA